MSGYIDRFFIFEETSKIIISFNFIEVKKKIDFFSIKMKSISFPVSIVFKWIVNYNFYGNTLVFIINNEFEWRTKIFIYCNQKVCRTIKIQLYLWLISLIILLNRSFNKSNEKSMKLYQ